MPFELCRGFSRSAGDLLRQLAGGLNGFQHAGRVVVGGWGFFVCVFFFSSYVYFISSLLTRSKNDNNSWIIRMNPTPVTLSDSSCAFGGYTGCLDGEFGLSAFTGSDMSSSVLNPEKLLFQAVMI